MSTTVNSTTVALYLLNDARTGEFLGFGTLLEENMIAVHPQPARQLLGASTRSTRLRCQIITNGGTFQVADGTVVTSTGETADLVAVKLDTVTEAVPDTIAWAADGAGHGADALRHYLDEAEAGDPATPPLPPPDASSGGTPAGDGTPGAGAPWCSWWTTGWGCKH